MKPQGAMLTPTRLSAGERPSSAALARIHKSLRSALGGDRVLKTKEILDVYAVDESGFGHFLPDFVIRAKTTQDVSIVLSEASMEGVPVTPRGGGTGRVGGALPICGGIVLSLEQMNRIVEVDEDNFTAIVEPGLVLEKFQNFVEEKGLFYPPDPSSLDSCSVGGNVACNAGGPRALKYGVTSNYVLGLEVVLPNGKIYQTGRMTVKGGAGYEVHKLMVGSEGTLAVITGITFKLIAKPTHLETALVTFADPFSASRAAAKILKAGVLPRSIEFMDRTSMAAARSRAPRHLPAEAGACLIVELDGFDESLLEEMGKVGEVCEAEKAQQIFIAQDESQRRDIWTARRELSPALRESNPCKVSEDIVVPRSRLPTVVERLEALAEKHKIKIAAFGHAGDGNIHVNVLFNEEQRPTADTVCLEVLKLAVEVGGTVAGEHGTGIQKVEAVKLEQSKEFLEFQYRLKRFFDPAGIMNPGKVVSGH